MQNTHSFFDNRIHKRVRLFLEFTSSIDTIKKRVFTAASQTGLDPYARARDPEARASQWGMKYSTYDDVQKRNNPTSHA